ncbi:TonB-dependent receptor domain-containing protein, partial [Hymenobacter agri]
RLGERLTVRGAVGRAIRAANFTEQYYSSIRPGTVPNGFNVGNPNLSAERTWSYEGGLDFQPLPALTLRGTYFNRYGRNLIDYVGQPGALVIEKTGLANLNPANTYRLAENLFAVSTQGFELEASTRAQLTPGLRLDGTVGYTYTHLNVDGNITSQYLSNVALQLISGNVSLVHRRFTASLGGVYKQRAGQKTTPSATINDAVLTPDYVVINGRLDVALLPERLWVVGQAQNLFDAKYSDLLGAQMPGRWLMAGVRVALRK